jgi:NAD(P)-dependent dehydrogenase (short-subunit alcohol dehydrogenase family)
MAGTPIALVTRASSGAGRATVIAVAGPRRGHLVTLREASL